MNKPISSYKGARILQEGNYFYVQMGTEKVQITKENALRIFMTCTSFGGDIQNRLYHLGDSYGVYPEHSEEYKLFMNCPRVQFASTELKNPSLKLKLNFGSIVQINGTKEELFYIGTIHAGHFSSSKYVRGASAPNSSKYFAFASEDKIYLIGHKSKLENFITVLEDCSKCPLKNAFPDYECAISVLKEYTECANEVFFDLSTKKKLDIVFVHPEKFKGEDLECTKRLCNLNLGELITAGKLSIRHFINIDSRDISFKCPELIPPMHYKAKVHIILFYLS